jgi:hypothetical protein
MRGLAGTFTFMPLREVIDFLARRKVSGTLVCERGAVQKTCQLVEGAVVEASSNDPREYLGHMLVHLGHLDEERLARAFAVQQETNVRLGKVLVMGGVVPAEVVRDTLAVKIRETLLDALLWESGGFSVEEGAPRERDELDAHVPLADIAREAEFRATAWQAFRNAFPAGATMLDVDEAKVPRGLDPASFNGRIVALARAGRTVDEMAVALHATDFHLYQRLYALWTQGALRASRERLSPVVRAAALLEDARGHLAAGRLEEAEEAAGGALAADPALTVAEGVRDEARAALGARLRREILEPPRTPDLRVPRGRIAGLPVSAREKWLLARCDGLRDAAALVRLAPAAELDVLRSLKRLAEQRLVAFR